MHYNSVGSKHAKIWSRSLQRITANFDLLFKIRAYFIYMFVALMLMPKMRYKKAGDFIRQGPAFDHLM